MSPLLIEVALPVASWHQALEFVDGCHVHEIQHGLDKHLLHRGKGSQLLDLLLLESQIDPRDADLGSRGRAFNVEYADLVQPGKQLLFRGLARNQIDVWRRLHELVHFVTGSNFSLFLLHLFYDLGQRYTLFEDVVLRAIFIGDIGCYLFDRKYV